MFKYQLQLAFDEYDSLTAASTPAATEDACSRLRDTFKKLYYLDVLDMITVKDKQSGEDSITPMTVSQVARNKEFRREEFAPRGSQLERRGSGFKEDYPMAEWRRRPGAVGTTTTTTASRSWRQPRGTFFG